MRIILNLIGIFRIIGSWLEKSACHILYTHWQADICYKETVDLTVYCRKLVCNSLKSEENMSALFVTRIDIF